MEHFLTTMKFDPCIRRVSVIIPAISLFFGLIHMSSEHYPHRFIAGFFMRSEFSLCLLVRYIF